MSWRLSERKTVSHLFCAIRRISCHLRKVLRENSWDDSSKESRMARAESGRWLMMACAASSAARSFSLPTQAASTMVETMMIYNSFCIFNDVNRTYISLTINLERQESWLFNNRRSMLYIGCCYHNQTSPHY